MWSLSSNGPLLLSNSDIWQPQIEISLNGWIPTFQGGTDLQIDPLKRDQKWHKNRHPAMSKCGQFNIKAPQLTFLRHAMQGFSSEYLFGSTNPHTWWKMCEWERSSGVPWRPTTGHRAGRSGLPLWQQAAATRALGNSVERGGQGSSQYPGKNGWCQNHRGFLKWGYPQSFQVMDQDLVLSMTTGDPRWLKKLALRIHRQWSPIR